MPKSTNSETGRSPQPLKPSEIFKESLQVRAVPVEEKEINASYLLVPQIDQLRQKINCGASNLELIYLHKNQAFRTKERQIAEKLASLHPPSEQLYPGLVYAGGGGILSSVLCRKSKFLTRLSAPLFTSALIFAAFFPKTTLNIGNSVFRNSNVDAKLVSELDSAISHADTLDKRTQTRISSAFNSIKKWIDKYK